MTAEQFDQKISKPCALLENGRALPRDVSIPDGRIQAGEAGLSALGKIVAKDVGLPPAKFKFQ